MNFFWGFYCKYSNMQSQLQKLESNYRLIIMIFLFYNQLWIFTWKIFYCFRKNYNKKKLQYIIVKKIFMVWWSVVINLINCFLRFYSKHTNKQSNYYTLQYPHFIIEIKKISWKYFMAQKKKIKINKGKKWLSSLTVNCDYYSSEGFLFQIESWQFTYCLICFWYILVHFLKQDIGQHQYFFKISWELQQVCSLMIFFKSSIKCCG
eukprot:TRINITY_DN5090_c1_g1_i7.p3 TRINITY_DN5090_c1_g1~~TRINITY_DN5090_c1_g1_i7.p3  ORF type:complete len:206 (-),score=-4.82 TRINITY_DN5090_c1_g1_i7:156-773(-)